MSRPVTLRHGARSYRGTIHVRGSAAALDVEGRRLEASFLREGARIDLRMDATAVSGERPIRAWAARDARVIWVSVHGRLWRFEVEHGETAAAGSAAPDGEIRAPMTGRVASISAPAGALVQEGDLLVTIEAMKMEFKLAAPARGRVADVACAAGDRVELGQLLVRLEPE